MDQVTLKFRPNHSGRGEYEVTPANLILNLPIFLAINDKILETQTYVVTAQGKARVRRIDSQAKIPHLVHQITDALGWSRIPRKNKFSWNLNILDRNDSSVLLSPAEFSFVQDYVDIERQLNREISRIASGIRDRVAASGRDRSGIHPRRILREAGKLNDTLKQIWHEQNGICPLCDKMIPLCTDNKLLRMSPDRTDSTNKIYDDIESVRITHFSCNMAKSDGNISNFKEWLNMIRSQ